MGLKQDGKWWEVVESGEKWSNPSRLSKMHRVGSQNHPKMSKNEQK